GEHRNPASHAVTGDDNAPRIDVETPCVAGVAHEGEHRIGIFEIAAEMEDARAAPRAAIIDGDGVPSGAADGLGEVEILLVPGKPVEENECRMRAGAGRDVLDAIDVDAAGR